MLFRSARLKIDRLEPEARAALAPAKGASARRRIAVSALSGEGIEHLRTAIDVRLATGRRLVALGVAPADGEALISLRLRMAPDDLERALRRPGIVELPAAATPPAEPALAARPVDSHAGRLYIAPALKDGEC